MVRFDELTYASSQYGRMHRVNTDPCIESIHVVVELVQDPDFGSLEARNGQTSPIDREYQTVAAQSHEQSATQVARRVRLTRDSCRG